eukprot:CAMPEP_0185020152 /NCGR_PEP_ID=MMETSP1103-20130426/2754_1 /TAXON_ID=36769 /ORGANISM="Paraphysomonas bandaiensis, Strain Caron Lab Isolate" /LENGTH=113 /DNA_ID=CAMNT_0027550879 /DNA_START=55 /DNA_END=396 /DNA_ORIENTATION=+
MCLISIKALRLLINCIHQAQLTVAPVAAPIAAPVPYAVPVIAIDCAIAIAEPEANPAPILAANSPPAMGPIGDRPIARNVPSTSAEPITAPVVSDVAASVGVQFTASVNLLDE